MGGTSYQNKSILILFFLFLDDYILKLINHMGSLTHAKKTEKNVHIEHELDDFRNLAVEYCSRIQVEVE